MVDKLTLTKAPKADPEALDAFLSGRRPEKKIPQLNIKVTEEEMETIKKGHVACLEKMPGYEYQKRAILEKAQHDIEKREKLNKLIAESEKVK